MDWPVALTSGTSRPGFKHLYSEPVTGKEPLHPPTVTGQCKWEAHGSTKEGVAGKSADPGGGVCITLPLREQRTRGPRQQEKQHSRKLRGSQEMESRGSSDIHKLPNLSEPETPTLHNTNFFPIKVSSPICFQNTASLPPPELLSFTLQN